MAIQLYGTQVMMVVQLYGAQVISNRKVAADVCCC